MSIFCILPSTLQTFFSGTFTTREVSSTGENLGLYFQMQILTQAVWLIFLLLATQHEFFHLEA